VFLFEEKKKEHFFAKLKELQCLKLNEIILEAYIKSQGIFSIRTLVS
jgi:hypothetical protein